MHLFNAIMGITTVSTAAIASTHLLMPNEFAINISNSKPFDTYNGLIILLKS